MLRLLKLELGKIFKPVITTTAILTVLTCILTCVLQRDYTVYFHIDAWEIGTEYIALLFPLFVTIPVCWQLYYERRDRFIVYTLSRISSQKLNHGDIKATQGDTGHSQADMVTKVYAHILDEDRKVNAQKFESAFYANPYLRGVQAPAEPAPALDVQSIILQLQQSPELLSVLTSLISNQGCK